METTVKERLIEYLKYKNVGQVKFAENVGLSRGFVNNIVNSIQPKTLHKIAMYYPDLNTSWLLTGDGEMLKEQSPAEDIAEESIDREYTTYLLPLSAMAGQLSGLATDGVFQSECEKIISPIKGVDFAITIHGDSMHPEYPSGSRILIKKINPSIFIEWGKVYVLDTDNGVVVKEIHKCENKENYITCHSINPDPKFADFDVNINEIHGMYRVLMCLSAK